MKKLMLISMLSLVAAAGCKKGDKDGGAAAKQEEAVTASPDCKDAGEHVQELSLRTTKADAPDSEKSAAFGKARELGDQVAASCTKDKWNADAIACVKTADSLATCKAKMSADQQKALPSL